MKAWEMFKSVFSESCPQHLARPHLNKYQIHTIEKLRDTLLPKLIRVAVRDEWGGVNV